MCVKHILYLIRTALYYLFGCSDDRVLTNSSNDVTTADEETANGLKGSLS